MEELFVGVLILLTLWTSIDKVFNRFSHLWEEVLISHVDIHFESREMSSSIRDVQQSINKRLWNTNTIYISTVVFMVLLQWKMI